MRLIVLCKEECFRIKDEWKGDFPQHPLEQFHFQFSSVQSLSRVWLFATPWIAARQASLSITISQSSLRLTSIESVMPSSHLILCRPLLLLPQSLPASGSLPMNQLFAWGGQSIGVSASASVLPVNTQDWSPSLRLLSIASVMLSNHLILCLPLFLLPSTLPSIRVISNELVFRIRWPNALEFQFQHQTSQWIFSTDFLQDWLVGSLCSPRNFEESPPHHNLKASILQCSAFFVVQDGGIGPPTTDRS